MAEEELASSLDEAVQPHNDEGFTAACEELEMRCTGSRVQVN
jgi:hypothetical protein